MTMWSPDRPSMKTPAVTTVLPNKVLYKFDGPQIFTANFGFLSALFVKAEDFEDSLLWIAAQCDDKLVEMISNFSVSVRCAFNQENLFVIRTNEEFEIIEYWPVKASELDESMLPMPEVALNGIEHTPDNIEQATSFFSMRFAGQQLGSDGSMLFSEYRSLVDRAFEATKRILNPRGLVDARSNIIDYRVKQAVGSLIIAIERPILNLDAAQQRLRDRDLPYADVVDSFDNQRDAFFGDMDDLLDMLENYNSNPNSIDERFGTIDTIHDIIPTGENSLSSVTFSGSYGSVRRSITIGENAGAALHGAYKELSGRPINEVGQIEIINNPKCSFVIVSSVTGRQITCYVNPDEYETLSEDERFKIGVNVRVAGRFWRRSRRDIMSVEGMPRIS